MSAGPSAEMLPAPPAGSAHPGALPVAQVSSAMHVHADAMVRGLCSEVEKAVRSKLESEDTEGIGELFDDVDDSIDPDDLIEMAEEDLEEDELALARA